MPDTKKEIAEIIKFGIKTEIEGQNFYSTLAQKIVHPDARKKIEQLAADEANHERRLRKLHDRFVGTEVTDLPEKGLGIFKDAFGDKPLADKDTMRLIALAMEAERLSAKHYKMGEDKAADLSVRECLCRTGCRRGRPLRMAGRRARITARTHRLVQL